MQVASKINSDYNLHAMKKLLLIFALLIFPLQMSWAVADAYCQQEQSLSSPHCMDCVPQSRVLMNDMQDSDAPSAADSSLDCSQCNGNTAPLATIRLDILAFPPNAVPSAIESHLPLSAFVMRPERPQWSLAAV